ncbi:MAG: hypothetical protein ACRD0U_07890, partial [Acidimicrobiales bacterium]
PIASTRLVVVVPDTAAPCQGPVDWQCLGESPSAKVGMPPPDSALGLVLLGNAVSGYFGRPDVSSNNLRDDPEFGGWLRRITARPDNDPLGRLVELFPPTLVFDAVGATQAGVRTLVDGQRAEGRVTVLHPDPPAAANIVLVAVSDSDRVTDLADNDELRDALAEDGWSTPESAATGLPDPGVLLYLLTL